MRPVTRPESFATRRTDPYPPGIQTESEVTVAEFHLDGCDYCRRRYRFEESLRRYVKLSAVERMPPGLMERLAQLRTLESS